MTKILILDGGLGTSLEQNHKITFGPSTPLWSSHLLISELDQDTLLRCQKDFGDVPVDIILTATYQVSIDGFANTKTAQFPNGINHLIIPEFLETAVSIAEKAKHQNAKIALSLGPYGACMVPSQEYSGKYDDAHNSGDALLAWHRERMQLFASGIQNLRWRVNYVALETIPRVDEIIAMRRALDSVPDLISTETPSWMIGLSPETVAMRRDADSSPPKSIPFWMSCLFPNEDENLPDGTSPEEAVRAMLDPTLAKTVPWGIGINCTKVWRLDSLLRRYEAAVSSMLQEGLIQEWPALVLYPDGTNGEVYNTTTKQWELPDSTSKEDRIPWESQLAKVVQDIAERGKWSQIVVGGCCMARPEDIRRLRSCLVKDK